MYIRIDSLLLPFRRRCTKPIYSRGNYRTFQTNRSVQIDISYICYAIDTAQCAKKKTKTLLSDSSGETADQ